MTGSTVFGPEHNVKPLELLRRSCRASPGGLALQPGQSSSVTENEELERAARSRKLEISYFEARNPATFDAAFTAMAKRPGRVR